MKYINYFTDRKSAADEMRTRSNFEFYVYRKAGTTAPSGSYTYTDRVDGNTTHLYDKYITGNLYDTNGNLVEINEYSPEWIRITGASSGTYYYYHLVPKAYLVCVPNCTDDNNRASTARDRIWIMNPGVEGDTGEFDDSFNDGFALPATATTYEWVLYGTTAPSSYLFDTQNTYSSIDDCTPPTIVDYGAVLAGSSYYTKSYDASGDWYGVEFSSSSPDGIRIGNPSLHQSCPIQSGMRCCLLSDDGTVASYLSSTDRTKLEDGTTTASLDGSTGQVMVEIPEHYRRLEYDSSSWRVMVSTVALDGFVHVPKCYIGAYKATVDRSTSTYKLSSVKNSTAAFRGGNGSNSSWDGTYRTLLQRPASNESLITYRTYAANRGTGWYQHLWDIKKAVYWLFVTEYATLNSQKAFNSTLLDDKYHQGGLGDGVTTLASAAWNTFNSYHPFTDIGITDSLGNATGTVSFTMPTEYSSTTTTVSVPSYRGIENPFGEIWEWVDGICVDVQSSADGNKSLIYTCNDLSGIDYTSSLSAYDYVGDAARSSGYASQMVQNTTGDVVPTTVGGSASTYFCDYYYTTVPSSGTSRRGVIVGGHAHYGAYAGLVYVYTYHVPSTTSAYVGSRLCYLP